MPAGIAVQVMHFQRCTWRCVRHLASCLEWWLKKSMQDGAGALHRPISSQLDRHCRADGRQQQLVRFRRYMNRRSYKNQWSDTDSGTHWAAAKLLECEGNLKKRQQNSKVPSKRSGRRRPLPREKATTASRRRRTRRRRRRRKRRARRTLQTANPASGKCHPTSWPSFLRRAIPTPCTIAAMTW